MGRGLLWAVVGVGGSGLLACSGLMAQRVVAFHEANPRTLYLFSRVHDRAFDWHGRRVELIDESPAAPGDVPRLLVRFGEREFRLNVAVPGNPKLPGMLPHEDWLRVLRFGDASGMTPEEFVAKLDSGEIVERLALVTRMPRPGSDPRTWGSVWKKDWSFDFYELMPDGEIRDHPRLRYPTTRGVRPPREGELRENTWEFQAALQLMPQAGGVGPTHNFFGNAVAAAGWTLPAGAFCGLAFTVCLAFAVSPRRRGGRSWASLPREPAPA